MASPQAIGIAATERHGGSRIREITTQSRLSRGAAGKASLVGAVGSSQRTSFWSVGRAYTETCHVLAGVKGLWSQSL